MVEETLLSVRVFVTMKRSIYTAIGKVSGEGILPPIKPEPERFKKTIQKKYRTAQDSATNIQRRQRGSKLPIADSVTADPAGKIFLLAWDDIVLI